MPTIPEASQAQAQIQPPEQTEVAHSARNAVARFVLTVLIGGGLGYGLNVVESLKDRASVNDYAKQVDEDKKALAVATVSKPTDIPTVKASLANDKYLLKSARKALNMDDAVGQWLLPTLGAGLGAGVALLKEESLSDKKKTAKS